MSGSNAGLLRITYTISILESDNAWKSLNNNSKGKNKCFDGEIMVS